MICVSFFKSPNSELTVVPPTGGGESWDIIGGMSNKIMVYGYFSRIHISLMGPSNSHYHLRPRSLSKVLLEMGLGGGIFQDSLVFYSRLRGQKSIMESTRE